MRVVEYTGGSTGSSLAMVCAVKGYAFVPLSSDAFAREKIQTMEAFGAEVEIVPSDGGKVTPALFDRFRERIATLKDEPGTFWTDQFNNADALNGYRDIGVELLEQVGSVDVFCGAVGTAGMLVGVSRALKAGGSRARIVALEPTGSPVLTTGRGGAHRVEGTAAGFVPPHLTPRRLRRGAGHRRRGGAGDGAPAREGGRHLRRHLDRPERRRRSPARARAGLRSSRRDGRGGHRTEIPGRRPVRPLKESLDPSARSSPNRRRGHRRHLLNDPFSRTIFSMSSSSIGMKSVKFSTPVSVTTTVSSKRR